MLYTNCSKLKQNVDEYRSKSCGPRFQYICVKYFSFNFCAKTICFRLKRCLLIFFITIKFYQICIIVRTLVRNLSILTTFNWRSCDWVSFMSPSNSPAQEIQSGSLWAPSNGPSAGYLVFQYFHINYNAIPTYFCLDIYLLSNCYSVSYILNLKTSFRHFFFNKSDFWSDKHFF